MRRALALSLILCAPAGAFEVKLSPENPAPGDVVRVEVLGIDNPERMRLTFQDKEVPFFPIGPGRMRALVGLTAREKAGWYALNVERKRFLLPAESKALGIEVSTRAFTHQHLRLPEKKTKLASKPAAKTALEDIRRALDVLSPVQLWAGVFLRPAKGRQSSSYGHTRTINDGMSWSWHKGIDIAAADGQPVRAPNAGRVALTGRYPVQGGTVILDHGQGLHSAFLHLSGFSVEVGQLVEKGQPIATVGGGGFSTGSHLHWGVYIHGRPVDPTPLMQREL